MKPTGTVLFAALAAYGGGGDGAGKFASAFVATPGTLLITSSLISPSAFNPVDESPSHDGVSREDFVSLISSTLFSTMLLPVNPQSANADEPTIYKSKADEEDPLVVFGKSLENMNLDPSSSSSTSSGGDVKGGSLSFGGIALPSDASSTPPQMGDGGDLGNALKERKESQKRAIDPRTHG